MTKFSCTMSSGSIFYYATLIAEDAQQAREMAVAEVTKKAAGSAGRPRDWSVRAIEEGVDGPARTLDFGQRNA